MRYGGDVSVMTRKQLRGAIGYATYAIPRLEKLCARYEAEGALPDQLAITRERLMWFRQRLSDVRAEWDRRGYVVRSGPSRQQRLLEREIGDLMRMDPTLDEANAEIFARAGMCYRGERWRA